MLQIDALTFPFADFTGCYTLGVKPGAFVGLVGPSGGGKTTLLDGLGGFLRSASGTIRFEGQDITHQTPGERPVAMLFQDHNLFPDVTVTANVGLGIRPSLRLDENDARQVEGALTAVGLSGFGRRLPRQLSGGERQRAALARALVSGKRLLLLDEPFSGLDPGLRKAMLALLDGLRREAGLTVLLSIHTPEDLLGVADSVAFIAEGRVGFSGSPESFFATKDNPAINRYLGA